MLSRIAESLYWMRRYAERADGILRMLRINFITSLDHNPDFSWQPTLRIFTSLSEAEIEALAKDSDAVLRYVICSRENANSIRNIAGRARENARGIQDHVTKEVWESLNAFYHKVNGVEVENAIERKEQIVMLGELLNHCLLFFGVSDVTMPRGQGWNYMNLGKFVERGIQTADMLEARFGIINYDLNNPSDLPYWRNLLLSLSGYELYLKRYHSGLQSRNVAELAILNPEFPRSILYCTARLDRTMHEMAQEDISATPQLQKIVGRLRSKVEYTDIETISQTGLHRFLSEVRQDIVSFNTALGKTYFAYS